MSAKLGQRLTPRDHVSSVKRGALERGAKAMSAQPFENLSIYDYLNATH